MPHYRSVGDVPAKRHVRHRQPDGRLYHEELVGETGFSGSSALLYHRHSPSALLAVDAVDLPMPTFEPNVPVRPLHLRPEVAGADLVTGRTALLGNADVVLAVAGGSRPSPLYRNAAADEVVFVHEGSASLETSYGSLDVAAGDYVVLPRGTTHRWLPQGPVRALVLEVTGHVTPPKRYLSPGGQFVESAPYCERDVRAPGAPLLLEGDDVEVLVRRADGWSSHRHATHPFDVAGWDGCHYPWALSIRDFEPIVGSIHQPPPVHQTFEAPGLVVCSFVPRPFDFHPDAVKVPYHHANVDSDEVLFYVAGDFMSRAGAGIGVGSITLHPSGFTHGPQPGSVGRAADQDRTEETAVMLDTFRPLGVSAAALAVSDPGYLRSWLERDDPAARP